MNPIYSIGTQVFGSIFDSVFGSVDKGHWEGSSFIPGDYENRLRFVQQQLAQRGLYITDVDYSYIDTILKSTGIWQGKVTSYLDTVVANKKNTSSNKENLAGFETNINAGLNNSLSSLLSSPLILAVLTFFAFKLISKK
jgi:hypothetical protein